MDLRPRKRVNTSDGLGRGMEFAILVVMFLGLGYALDTWLGTKPVFMIVFVVLGIVGQFASLWYGYDARMKELEAQRRDLSRDGKAAVR
ncbi:MAG: AtpZ/AtpI family protein [Actinomycetota bacterium]